MKSFSLICGILLVGANTITTDGVYHDLCRKGNVTKLGTDGTINKVNQPTTFETNEANGVNFTTNGPSDSYSEVANVSTNGDANYGVVNIATDGTKGEVANPVNYETIEKATSPPTEDETNTVVILVTSNLEVHQPPASQDLQGYSDTLA